MAKSVIAFDKVLPEIPERARAGVAQAVNAARVIPSWRVGQRIRKEILKNNAPPMVNRLCRHRR